MSIKPQPRRPARITPRVRPAWDRPGGTGFRLERLNPEHIRLATDTFAIGFVDHRRSDDGEYGRGQR